MIESHNYFSNIFKKIYDNINSDSFFKQVKSIQEEGNYILVNIFKDFDQEKQKVILLNRYFDNKNHISYFGYSKAQNKIIAGGKSSTVDFLPISPIFNEVNNSSIIDFFEKYDVDDNLFQEISNNIKDMLLDSLLKIQQAILNDENNGYYDNTELRLINHIGSFGTNAYDYVTLCNKDEYSGANYLYLLRDDDHALKHILTELLTENVMSNSSRMLAVSSLIKWTMDNYKSFKTDFDKIFSKDLLDAVFSFYTQNSDMVTNDNFITISEVAASLYVNDHVTNSIISQDFYKFITNKNIYNIYMELLTTDYLSFFKKGDDKKDYNILLSKQFLSVLQKSVAYFKQEKMLHDIQFKIAIHSDLLATLIDDDILYRERIRSLSNIKNIIKSDSFYISSDVPEQQRKHLSFYIKAIFLQDLFFKKYNKIFEQLNEKLQ